MSDLVSQLTALLGSDVVRSDAVSLQAYSRDATPMFEGLPEVIVAPRNTNEVSKIVKFAHDTKTPIIARGAGSNLCAATVPLNGGIVMSMTNMNKCIKCCEANLKVHLIIILQLTLFQIYVKKVLVKLNPCKIYVKKF